MRILILVAASALAILPAGADVLNFDLTSSSLSAPAGTPTTLEFTGTLSNPGTTVVFLNGDVNFLDQSMTLDDSPFFNFAPLSLAGGASYNGPFFDVDVYPTTPSGIYPGTFTIQGGANDNAFDNLATADFTVKVTGSAVAVPEPGYFAVLLFALAILIISLQHSGRTQSPRPTRRLPARQS
jgi:hypothetical protein